MLENNFMNAIADKNLKDSFSIACWHNKTFESAVLYRANYHRIFLIKDGAGNLQIDHNLYPVSGSELFLLAKGQLFRFHPNTIITGYELCFGDCFWEKTPASANNCKAVLFNNAEANQHLSINEVDCTELNGLFHTLYLEFAGDDYINKLDALAAYLKIIMIKIANVNAALSKAYDSHENKLYRQFLELVSKQYQTTHEVAEFAEQLGISARKLADLCKQCSGKGAKEIITGQIIAEAKRALQFSSKPIKEISFELNFSSPDQFSHFFKKITATSPQTYRERFTHFDM